MLLIIGVAFLILLMIGYFKTKSIFSPEVLVTGTWSLIIILYYILPHNLYSINGRFIECILLWVVFFISRLLLLMQLQVVENWFVKKSEHI